MPLQGCIKSLHCLSIRFVAVAFPPVQCSNTGLKMRNKKCVILIHSSNVWVSYWIALEQGCLPFPFRHLEWFRGKRNLSITLYHDAGYLTLHGAIICENCLSSSTVSLHCSGEKEKWSEAPSKYPSWHRQRHQRLLSCFQCAPTLYFYWLFFRGWESH